jgi:hypothetical protein
VFPGDAPWINDEPRLILNALTANEGHRLAKIGIEGSVGLRYGPVPTWIYQALLSVSHNLELLVVLRASMTMIASAVGLTWLARGLRVSSWFVPLSLASPYLWFYSRSLWDNTFLIPLAALTIGGYIAFLGNRRTGFLLFAAACGLIMPLIHLMAIAVVVPLFVHASIFARRELWRARYALLALLLLGLTAGYGYFSWLIDNHSRVERAGNLVAATFPFIGGRWLSAISLDEFFQNSYRAIVSGSVVLDIARTISVAMLPAVWVGILLATVEVRSRSDDRREELIFLLMILAGQMVLSGVTGAVGPAHYFNATWPVFAALGWLSLDRLLAFRRSRWLPATIGVSLVIVVAAMIARIHRLGGTRGDAYGPVLSNQMEIARELNRAGSNSRMETDVDNFRRFPAGFAVLRRLATPATRLSTSDTTLTVRFIGEPASGRVGIVHRE